MMGESCLEMKDDAPEQTENNRRVAIDDTRGADAEQVHLKDNREKVQSRKVALRIGVSHCHDVSTSLSPV